MYAHIILSANIVVADYRPSIRIGSIGHKNSVLVMPYYMHQKLGSSTYTVVVYTESSAVLTTNHWIMINLGSLLGSMKL